MEAVKPVISEILLPAIADSTFDDAQLNEIQQELSLPKLCGGLVDHAVGSICTGTNIKLEMKDEVKLEVTSETSLAAIVDSTSDIPHLNTIKKEPHSYDGFVKFVVVCSGALNAPNRMEADAAVQSITELNANNTNNINDNKGGQRHDDSDPDTSLATFFQGDMFLHQQKDDDQLFKVAVYKYIRESSMKLDNIMGRLDVIEKSAAVESSPQRAIAAAPTKPNTVVKAGASVAVSSWSSEAWANGTNIGNHSRITILWKTNYCDSLDSTKLFAITSSNRRTLKIPKIAFNSKCIAAFPATRVTTEFIINPRKRQVKPMKVSLSLSSSVSTSILTSYGKTSCFTMKGDDTIRMSDNHQPLSDCTGCPRGCWTRPKTTSTPTI